MGLRCGKWQACGRPCFIFRRVGCRDAKEQQLKEKLDATLKPVVAVAAELPAQLASFFEQYQRAARASGSLRNAIAESAPTSRCGYSSNAFLLRPLRLCVRPPGAQAGATACALVLTKLAHPNPDMPPFNSGQ